MEKGKKKDPNEGIITLEEFEGIMNKESLRKLPTLVNSMDENLQITITEFINNPVLKDIKIHQQKLIEVIKSSHKFHYDNKTGMIKFREKADRNILIINNFIKNEDEKVISEKENFIRGLIKEKNVNYAHKIKKIDKVGSGFHVVFDHEDISMEVEKHFLEGIFNKTDSGNTLLQDLKQSQICLAAESLKRRVVSAFDPNFNSLWAQMQFVKTIILNPAVYIPRRFTLLDNNLLNLRKNSNSPGNKFDLLPAGNKKKFIHHSNTLGTQPRGSKNKLKVNVDHRMSIQSNPQLQSQFTPNNVLISMGSKRASKVVHNKYDLIDPTIAALHFNFNPEMQFDTRVKANTTYSKNKQPEIKMDRRISYNPYQMMMNQNASEKRRSFITPMHHMFNPHFPLNKEYDITIDDPVVAEGKDISSLNYSYDTKEIMSVYFHMNFLKKFDLPAEFKENFNSGFMTESPKTILESFKIKKAEGKSNHKQRDKERSKSIFVHGTRRISSQSRSRLSQNFSHQLMKDFNKEVQYYRKRNTSLKDKL